MKTCDGCRASWNMGYSSYCGLEYNIKVIEIVRDWGKFLQPIPLEKCPKPKTWKKYFNSEHAKHL